MTGPAYSIAENDTSPEACVRNILGDFSLLLGQAQRTVRPTEKRPHASLHGAGAPEATVRTKPYAPDSGKGLSRSGTTRTRASSATAPAAPGRTSIRRGRERSSTAGHASPRGPRDGVREHIRHPVAPAQPRRRPLSASPGPHHTASATTPSRSTRRSSASSGSRPSGGALERLRRRRLRGVPLERPLPSPALVGPHRADHRGRLRRHGHPGADDGPARGAPRLTGDASRAEDLLGPGHAVRSARRLRGVA